MPDVTRFIAIYAAISRVPSSKVLILLTIFASFPPATKKSWYDEKVVINGAVPDSLNVTVMAPAGIDAPAAGVTNSTSARAKEAIEPNSASSWSRMANLEA